MGIQNTLSQTKSDVWRLDSVLGVEASTDMRGGSC